VDRVRERNGGSLMIRHTVGNAIVLHGSARISLEAQSVALAVPPDPENDIVVLDVPPGPAADIWEAAAAALPRRRRGIRLMVCGAPVETAALAGQWFADRLGRSVVAPHGHPIVTSGGTVFVHAGEASGWVRHRRGQPPAWVAKRFPSPAWDAAAADYRVTSATAVVEPLPGGAWLHGPDDNESGHWRRLVTEVPCLPDAMTVVIGLPGGAQITLDDVARFWRKLDDDSRTRTRFVQYGPVELPPGETMGQALADLFERPVVCYGGLPIGATDAPQMYTVDAGGALGWRVFTYELGYTPRTGASRAATAPTVLSHRPPLDLTDQVAAGVYWYANDAVIEVIPAGLLVRPVQASKRTELVRAQSMQPGVQLAVFDDTVRPMAPRMRLLAEDVLARLDPATRERSALVPMSSVLAQAVARREAMGRLGVDDAEPRGDDMTVIRPATAAVADALDLAAVVQEPTAETPVITLRATTETAPVFSAEAPSAPADVVALVGHPTTETPVLAPRLQPEKAPPTVAPGPEPVPAPDRVLDPGPGPVSRPLPDPVRPPVLDALPEPVLAAAPTPVVPELVPTPLRGPVTGTAVGPAVGPTLSDADTVAYTSADLMLTPRPGARREETSGPDLPPGIPFVVDDGGRSVVPVDHRADPAGPEPDADLVGPELVGPELDAELVSPEPDVVPAGAPDDSVEQPWIDEVSAWPRSLRGQFSRYAEPVSRIIAADSQFRDEHEKPEELLAQAVAVQLYLTGSGRKADDSLRDGHEGYRAFGQHVIAGLRRLPLHRGSVLVSAAPTEPQWQRLGESGVLHEPFFTHALVTPDADLHGDTDVLIWSNSAHRTTLLEPGGESPVDRVVFLPGARFEVLDVARPGTAGARGAVLLRELAEDEQDDDRAQRAAFNELVTNIMRRWAAQWPVGPAQPQLPAEVLDRCRAIPGVD
jgi:hypothetical protein